MKFRKSSSSSSPKMELLSRRSSSSSNKVSNFKRSRSFRASVKLMSKIKSRATMKLGASFDLSPTSAKDEGCRRIKQDLSLIIEGQGTAQVSLSPLKDPDIGGREASDGDKEKLKEKDIRRSLSAVAAGKDSDKRDARGRWPDDVERNDSESRKITRDLRSKLSLTEKIMTGRTRKEEVERRPSSSKDNDASKSPRVAKIFQRRSVEREPRENWSRLEDIGLFTRLPSEHMSYENPTFCLDSSTDSSVSGFLFETADAGNESLSREEPSEEERASSTVLPSRSEEDSDILTILVDSDQVHRQSSGSTSFALRRDLQMLTKRDSTECNGRSFSRFQRGSMVKERLRFGAKNNQALPKSEEFSNDQPADFSASRKDSCASRSYRVRTVDNLTNFWSGGRGSSFRSKIATGKKKPSSRELESIGQDRVLVTTSSGSKLHSLQGMEFLEGFGKKKQQPQQHLNNFSSIHINPLSTQSLNIHLHALFAAVEHGHLDKARTILESTNVDVNSLNDDGLSPLDVAVLSNNRSLGKMLVAFGAQEGNQFKSPESLGSHLASLLSEAEHTVQELGGTTSGSGGTTLLEPPSTHRASFSAQHNNLTGCGGSADDKELALWERRTRALKKMLLGFDQARPPDMPFIISVDVTGVTSVSVRFQETDSHDSSICTKFKVQWSTKEDFSVICGEIEVSEMKKRECRIDGLVQGQRYHFRAAAGNLKGYSRFRNSTPCYVTPSSWRDIDGREPRFAGRLEQLDTLFTGIRRPEYTQETPAVQRRNHKKKPTIKQLFTATANKFQKNLRRGGVFLACLLYHEDKVLVTNEDFLPVIEVDETYPSCIHNDFYWLMKVACTWDDVKSLRQDMDKSHTSSTNHFRIKILQAAAQMQDSLCTQDLGQLYHKPIRDVQGTLVFSTVNYVKSPKLVSVLNSRWLPLAKVTKKVTTHENSNVADILMASIQEQMTYHQVSSIKLSKGLYLGYLKMQSSVDLIQVVVPTKAPNVLPHCKIRDNPHVSAEEWDYLKRVTRIHASDASVKDNSEEKENLSNEAQGTEQQKLFVDLVSATARRLFNYMEISPTDSLIHRLYDAEVIDLTHDVSFLIAVPPPETACCVPGAREILLQRGDLLSLPIQIFEMVHLNTYQKDVISRYSRLSCILELDTAQAQHSHREAFSSSELSVAKDKLARLQDIQSQVNTVWKGARWLIDVITFARDRGMSPSGICMKHLLSLDRNKNGSNSLKRSLLQLPPRDPKLVKSSPGRGSWPGPNVTNSSSNLLTTEFSKSEQQLPSGQYTRKGSNTSNVSNVSSLSGGSEPLKASVPMSSGSNISNITNVSGSNHLIPLQNTRLPPSKSEDTLLLTKYKQSPRNRSATITSVSASTSPLLSIKPIMYGGSFLSVSAAMTNTTSQLSVSNTNSDSLHSLSSDEFATPAGVYLKPGMKIKSSKPTASVAAMASSVMASQLDEEKEEATMMPPPQSGILQVFAAYETGLASGTSLKLRVTPRTTAREVVDLVVNQLNMAVRLKEQDGPIYRPDELPNFCLVAVIGARERCLRDDFKPLQLQNPWKKGRLYVRQKQDVLAALEHSSKHTAYL